MKRGLLSCLGRRLARPARVSSASPTRSRRTSSGSVWSGSTSSWPPTAPSTTCSVGLMEGGLHRLTGPLVREGGRLRPASWEEALTRAAAGFEGARQKGPQAFGFFFNDTATTE